MACRASRRAFPALVALAACTAVAPEASAQLRRAPAIRHVSLVQARDLVVGYGLDYRSAAGFPLSGATGDLFTPIVFTAGYGLGSGAIVELRANAWQILRTDSINAPPVDLNPEALDGTTSDFGDFRIATRFRVIGGERGLWGGLGFELKLPTGREAKGITTNTTDVALTGLAGLREGRWLVTAEAGVGILEVPLENFVQNDVLVYGAEALYSAGGGRLRFAAGLHGRASTRPDPPLGTEDLGEVAVGADCTLGGFLLDAAVLVGYTELSPDWGLSLGVAYNVSALR